MKTIEDIISNNAKIKNFIGALGGMMEKDFPEKEMKEFFDKLLSFVVDYFSGTSSEEPPKTDYRYLIAKKIVEWEGRYVNGKLQVYKLPSNDGGGEYEVAGINQKYDTAEAKRLKDLIEQGKNDQAEKEAAEYIAGNTDVVNKWTMVPAFQAFLRDTVFNRGQKGASKILQIALGVSVDGVVGPITKESLSKRNVSQSAFIHKLRDAREYYERHYVGYRANFWNGLVNRWNNVEKFALTFAEN